jgi:hypothetical protein
MVIAAAIFTGPVLAPDARGIWVAGIYPEDKTRIQVTALTRHDSLSR